MSEPSSPSNADEVKQPPKTRTWADVMKQPRKAGKLWKKALAYSKSQAEVAAKKRRNALIAVSTKFEDMIAKLREQEAVEKKRSSGPGMGTSSSIDDEELKTCAF